MLLVTNILELFQILNYQVPNFLFLKEILGRLRFSTLSSPSWMEQDTEVEIFTKQEKDFETIKSNFSCAICLSITEEPCMTPCGHLFCYDCLMQWINLNHNSICPKCRNEFTQDSIVHIANGYSTKHKKNIKYKKKILKPSIAPQNMVYGNLIIYQEEPQKPTIRSIFITTVFVLIIMFLIEEVSKLL